MICMCHPETYMVHHLLPALLPEHTAGPLSKVEVQSTVDIELWSSDDVSQQPLWLCSTSESPKLEQSATVVQL